jgi:hypothetical protein
MSGPRQRPSHDQQQATPRKVLALLGGVLFAGAVLVAVLAIAGGRLRAAPPEELPVPSAPSVPAPAGHATAPATPERVVLAVDTPAPPTATWPATATPAPGQAYPIWWTVHAEQAADGRTVYRVDQPGVETIIEQHYREMLAFFSNQAGLPDLSQAPRYSVPAEIPQREANIATAAAQGKYWRTPVLGALNWQGEPEFSADGAEVTWTFVVDAEQIAREGLRFEQVDLATGNVVATAPLVPLRQTVSLRYDPEQGRWLYHDAASRAEYLPTPTPKDG